jgi:arylsulfatase A-like enzyme
MPEPATSPPPATPAARRRPRLPLLLTTLGAAGFLGIVQASILVLRNQESMGPEIALGLSRLALLVALVTMLVLMPVAWLLRRRLGDERGGDRLQASWSICFALAAGLASWGVANLLSDGLLPRAVGPWAALAVAVPVGFAASYLRPPRPWLLGWCWASVVLVALNFVPWPPPPGAAAASKDASAGASAPASTPRRPDVVLISIDTLRADHLGPYGRKPSITPAIDRIAAEGVVFARTLASAPWTTPSLASLLTGLPTVRHDAGRPLRSGPTFERSPLGNGFTTLAERFAAAGYRTRAVVANGFIGPQSGMAQGFDEFVNPSGGAFFAGMMRDLPLTRLIVAMVPVAKWGDLRAEGLTEVALGWLSQPDDRPLFLWVHYMDPHAPYQRDPARLDPMDVLDMVRQKQPKPQADGTIVGEVFGNTDMVRSGLLWLGPRDRERLAGYYAGEVAYVDRHVGRLVDALRRRAGARPVVAALTADHGEELWDHGHFEHGHDYYLEVTRVPLIFWGPGIVPGGRRVESPAGLVDVGATLLDRAGLRPTPPKFADEGRSLVAAFAAAPGSEPPARWYAAGGNLYGLPSALLEEGPWCYVLRANDHEELYDVINDPGQRRNVAALHGELAARFRERLRPQLAALLHTSAGGVAAELTPEQREALKALGYAR